MSTTVLEPDHAAQAEFLIPIEPAIDSVGLARLDEGMAGNSVRGHAISNLEQGGTAFANVGPGVVVAVVEEFVALGFRQVEGSECVKHFETTSSRI
jgi:hypothetical protein